eukprot:TRINITY_DN49197_c0_g1_i5.p1 TRINITY_DN49197_c0_g1~~TRINITY_DN49197_c0_g1_i5.p1  ORF type:complete len:245 (-),score=21.97 TRINITY_DN49197_c0_g1_i5:467-1201(-)
MLLQHQADVTAKDVHGTTALHVACNQGPIEMVELLLRSRASVNQSDSWSNPWPLHKAACAGNADVNTISLLLECKANPNKRDLRMKTACESAAEMGPTHAPIVALLQSYVDKQDDCDSDDYSEPELGDLPVFSDMYAHPGWQTEPVLPGGMRERTYHESHDSTQPTPSGPTPGQQMRDDRVWFGEETTGDRHHGCEETRGDRSWFAEHSRGEGMSSTHPTTLPGSGRSHQSQYTQQDREWFQRH